MYKNKGKEINQLEYSWIISSIIYVINCTRSNIAYSITKLSRFTSKPSMDHWKIIKRVLKYLRYTLNYELHYIDYPTVIERYSDAKLISDTKDSKSTSGYVFILGGIDVAWKHSK
jgi:hypothetical protein